jgi:chaperonin GroES
MKLKPLSDHVVIKPLEAEEKTAGGILLPDTAKEKSTRGEVLAVGSGRLLPNGRVIKMAVEVGDIVLYSKYGGTEIAVDNEDLLVLSSRDVLAKVTGAKKK